MGFPAISVLLPTSFQLQRREAYLSAPAEDQRQVPWVLTDLDPIKYNLLLNVFNPERISMPDIDTDVSDKRRDELIEYIVQKYGS